MRGLCWLFLLRMEYLELGNSIKIATQIFTIGIRKVSKILETVKKQANKKINRNKTKTATTKKEDPFLGYFSCLSISASAPSPVKKDATKNVPKTLQRTKID